MERAVKKQPAGLHDVRVESLGLIGGIDPATPRARYDPLALRTTTHDSGVGCAEEIRPISLFTALRLLSGGSIQTILRCGQEHETPGHHG